MACSRSSWLFPELADSTSDTVGLFVNEAHFSQGKSRNHGKIFDLLIN